MMAAVRLIVALLIWIAPAVAVAQGVMEIITLRYRSSAEVLPVIQPMLARDGTATGLQNQIVVRTTAANLEEIRRIVAVIDREPRRLVITVRDDIGAESMRQGGGVSGTVGGGDVRVTVPGGVPRDGAGVSLGDGQNRVDTRVVDTRAAGSGRGTQSVQVLEGNSAYIRTGESRPMPQRQVLRTVVNGRVVEQVVESTSYREAVTGLWVLPRLNGDRVTLELAPQREAFDNRRPGVVQSGSMLTTVSGRLGEWMELGGVDRSSSFESGTIAGRTSSTTSERRSTWVRVDELR